MSRQRFVDQIGAHPFSAALIALLSLYLLGIGAVLTFADIPAARQVAYRGPKLIMSLEAWGVVYLIAAVTNLARLAFLERWMADLILHVIGMVAIALWTLSFDWSSPLSVGQPAFTFIALLSFTSPFIARAAERASAASHVESRGR